MNFMNLQVNKGQKEINSQAHHRSTSQFINSPVLNLIGGKIKIIPRKKL